MKRFIALFLLLILSFSLVAYSNATGHTESTKEENDAANYETDTSGKVLVVYFSATGTTKSLAEYAADYLNAEIYEIIP